MEIGVGEGLAIAVADGSAVTVDLGIAVGVGEGLAIAVADGSAMGAAPHGPQPKL